MRVAFAFAIIIGFLVTNPVDAQVYHWSRATGSSDMLEFCTDVALDEDGNVYTMGWFSDTLDLDPGPAVWQAVANGPRDIYVQRFNADGSLAWACAFGAAGLTNEEAHGLALDGAGHLFVMGMGPFAFTVQSGGGSYSYVPATSFGLFILKFATDGELMDATALPGGDAVGPRNFGIAPNGDLIVGGSFRGTSDFDPGPGVVNATSLVQSSDDFYLLRLTNSFGFQWVKNSFHAIEFLEFDFDSQGNIVVCGTFVTSPDFDPSATSVIYSTGLQFHNSYVAKYTGTGDLLWAKGWGNDIGEDAATALAMDPQDNVYVTGYFQQFADFDAGSGTATLTADGNSAGYILKLQSDGTFVWAKEIGQRPTPPMTLSCSGLEWSPNADLVLSGVFTGNMVDINPGTVADSVAVTGSSPTAFILELDTAAELLQRFMFDGDGSITFAGIDLNTSGELAGAGRIFGSAVDMDPSAAVDSLYHAGTWDVFLLKMGVGPLSLPSAHEVVSATTYPNPGSTSFTIRNTEHRTSTVVLLDATGREVLRSKLTGDRTTIDCSALASGLFVYRLLDRSGAAMSSGKWIKE
jgi:hypothetical protein